MSKKNHRENTVGPWASEKLGKLEAYLRYYCRVMQNQNFMTVYLDAFAGAHLAKVRSNSHREEIEWPDFDLPDDDREEFEDFILGSPHRALGINPGFSKHYFFDLDEKRVETLHELSEFYPDKRIDPRCGDANKLVKDYANAIMGKRHIRGVAFLDPYGPQLEWETVEALAKTKTMEVLINFPAHMALNRLLCVERKDRREEWENAVSRVMGGDDWKQVVYPQSKSLFGDDLECKIDDTPTVLMKLYMSRLRTVFGHVAPPSLIRGTGGRPLYHLIWAGHHKKGLEGARYVLGEQTKLSKKAMAAPIGDRSMR